MSYQGEHEASLWTVIHSESCCMEAIYSYSEMAGPRGLKLGGLVEGIWENVLAKVFFGSVNIHQDQVGGPQVPLLGHGDEIETPNWACRDFWTLHNK